MVNPFAEETIHPHSATMRLRDYFFGIPVRLRSTLAPTDIAQRVNAAAPSMLLPWNEGVTGGVRFGLIRLRYQASMLEFNMKPILAGRIRSDPSGSLLVLRYRAPIIARLFFLFWYVFLFWASLMTLAYFHTPEGLAPALICALLLIAPIALVYGGTRRSDAELLDLLDFLAEEAGASNSPL